MVVTVWQDDAQLVNIYGQAKARTIWSNHWAKMYLPGINDEATLKQISDAVGSDEIERVSTSYGAWQGRTGVSVSPHDMPVAPVSWIRSLEKDHAIVISGSYPAMYLHTPAWFEDDRLRAKIDPDVARRYDAQFTAV